MSVTFSVGESEKMYTLNYLLYHFHVLKRKAIFGSKNAVTSISDEDVRLLFYYKCITISKNLKLTEYFRSQVWKVALKEEFNITNLNTISSEMYYEIWHSKYSEPGQLISKNYRINN